MSDCESITIVENVQNETHCEVSDRDDLSGMVLNMFGKVDIRMMLIIWISFLFLHSDLFIDEFLSKIKGCTLDNGGMSMRGTFYISILMMIIIFLCLIVFT